MDLKEIQEYLDNKTLLVIGNGESSRLTDTDIIVRINKGVIEGCDVWIDGISYLNYPDMPSYSPPPCIICLGKRALRAEHGWRQHPKDFQKMCKSLGLYRPSTGLMALWWLKEYINYKELVITGFNGDTNRYTGVKMYWVHDWDKERKIVKEWEDEKILRHI